MLPDIGGERVRARSRGKGRLASMQYLSWMYGVVLPAFSLLPKTVVQSAVGVRVICDRVLESLRSIHCAERRRTRSEPCASVTISLSWVIGSCLALTSCATVKFYKDEKLTEKTALRYYTAKPYLLVGSNSPDASPTAAVLYLPDKTDPTYVKFVPGVGSHNFSVGLSNGMLTSYGQQGDTKTAETLGAVAALLTAKAALITARKPGALDALPVETEGGAAGCPITEQQFREHSQMLGTIADELQTHILNIGKNPFTVGIERKKLEQLKVDLGATSKYLKDQGDIADISARDPCKKIGDRIRSILQAWDDVRLDAPSSNSGQVVRDNYETLRLHIVSTADAIDRPEPALTPAFELYEIIVTKDATTLRPARIQKP